MTCQKLVSRKQNHILLQRDHFILVSVNSLKLVIKYRNPQFVPLTYCNYNGLTEMSHIFKNMPRIMKQLAFFSEFYLF